MPACAYPHADRHRVPFSTSLSVGLNENIFRDTIDKDTFIERFGKIIMETSTPCYAGVLMDNHAHLLLRTGRVPIATLMRRLLTGYAQYFNRRQKRRGQLFQNRYKSLNIQVKGDERILGSGAFVEKVLRQANEKLEPQATRKALGITFDTLIDRVADHFGVTSSDLKTNSKAVPISKARAVLCYLCIRKLHISGAKVARRLNLSPSTVSKAVLRGQKLVIKDEIDICFIKS